MLVMARVRSSHSFCALCFYCIFSGVVLSCRLVWFFLFGKRWAVYLIHTMGDMRLEGL